MDPVAEWSAAHARVSALVTTLDEQRLTTRVPACPDWTVHDLLAHMVGLGVDVLAGHEPDDHHPSWTQAQVDARTDWDAAALLDEWAGVAARLPDWMREHGSRPLNDIVIHEQDLRGAVAAPGARSGAGLAIVRDRMAARLGDALAARPDLPSLALEEGPGDGLREAPDEGLQQGRNAWAWCSSGDPSEAAVVLRGSGFELFRAVTSRRTAEQLRGLCVRGDVSAHLDAFALLGPLPTEPLPE